MRNQHSVSSFRLYRFRGLTFVPMTKDRPPQVICLKLAGQNDLLRGHFVRNVYWYPVLIPPLLFGRKFPTVLVAQLLPLKPRSNSFSVAGNYYNASAYDSRVFNRLETA